MIDEKRLQRSATVADVLAGIRRHRGIVVSAAVALLVPTLSVALGLVDGSNALLVGLGFDPDRAQLITALVIGGATSFFACLCGGARLTSIALGFSATSGLFGATFVRETQQALAATGITGAFDPVGWGETLLAFVVIGLLTAWACATCALPVRLVLVDSAEVVVAAVKSRQIDRRTWSRPVATLVVLGLLAVTLPVAADLFNYGAGQRMIGGGPPRQGLAPDGQPDQTQPAATPTAGPTATPTATPSGSPSATASAAVSVTPSPSPTEPRQPWKTSPPSGQGRMVYLAFGAPWVNAGTATLEVAVYLPPGYDASGSRRYPAVYEAPFTFNLWNSGIHTKSMLDTLITGGVIPPSLVVFMNAAGGPFADSQCADSYDGREKMDHYMGVTVPTYIDKHYRTIARAAARAVMGMSEGGYCAAILALHHPDVFGSEISFSGYFTAGVVSPSARLPFANNPTLINKDSPSYVVSRLTPTVKSGLYAVIVAQRSQVFYGDEATRYAQVLGAAGISYSFIDASQPHGWPQVRDCLGPALTLVGLRQAELGVFT